MNNWFQFQQFKVYQEHASMKIGTDSVILGAWCTAPADGFALDIGCGTGILSLMIAQRTRLAIDAVDISEDACLDAARNFKESPWASRIGLHQRSVQDFACGQPACCPQAYDFILSNPPYFTKSLKSSVPARNLSRHDDSLSEMELLQAVAQLLSPSGTFSLILPADKAILFQAKAIALGFSLFRKLSIFPTQSKPANRTILEFKREKCISEEFSLKIRNENSYSDDYLQLTKEFYLQDYLKKNA